MGVRFLSFLLALGLGLSLAFAEDQPQSTSAGYKDQTQALERWKTLAAAGPDHKVLEKLVGTWTTVSRFWIDRSDVPQESRGECVHKMILGRRYLQLDCTGELLGTPFSGLGFVGYDNYRKQYVSAWMDNASTMMLCGTGSWNATEKTYSEVGDYQDPLTGTTRKFRNTIKVVDADTLLMESHSTGPDGKEVKDMEVTYTRKKP